MTGEHGAMSEHRPDQGISVALTLVVALVGAGCSRDAEVEAFIDQQSSVASDVVKAFKGASAKGEDADAAAAKVLDAQKPDLQRRYDSIKDARGFQIKDETKKKLEESVAANMMKVCALGSKKLCDDFMDVVK